MASVGGIGRDAAGKTGTNDNSSSAWFAGFTPDLAGAVSIGDPRGAQKYKLNGVTIGGRYYGSMFGASIPGPIWKDTMLRALRGVPPTDFTPVDTERFGGCGDSCRGLVSVTPPTGATARREAATRRTGEVSQYQAAALDRLPGQGSGARQCAVRDALGDTHRHTSCSRVETRTVTPPRPGPAAATSTIARPGV
ncbi:hypothetical protein [Microbispora sitophila]|uniref:hypothetical protein n=1 Tax=Microbispora sitophila TaxID=2771537 RepID=UPI00384FD7DE